MELEEAKKVLMIIQDNIKFELQFIGVEKTKTKLNEYVQAINVVISELVALQNLLDEKRDEIEHLQKKNEELKDRTLKYDKTLEALQRDTVWKKEIKELIENETIDISGFECVPVEDLKVLLKEE